MMDRTNLRTMEDLDAFSAALAEVAEVSRRMQAACVAASVTVSTNALSLSAAPFGIAAARAAQAEFEECGQKFETATARLLGERRSKDESISAFVGRISGLFHEGAPDVALARVMARNGLSFEGGSA